jgi:hypothetical protein
MITQINLYKLLVGYAFPKCVDCIHFKPAILSEGYCNIYGKILEARLGKLCGLLGKDYKKK